jgi:hypothetical protein
MQRPNHKVVIVSHDCYQQGILFHLNKYESTYQSDEMRYGLLEVRREASKTTQKIGPKENDLATNPRLRPAGRTLKLQIDTPPTAEVQGAERRRIGEALRPTGQRLLTLAARFFSLPSSG